MTWCECCKANYAARGRPLKPGFGLTDVHVLATVAERDEEAWAAARALDDALWLLSGRTLPKRTILVDDRIGRISIDTSGEGFR